MGFNVLCITHHSRVLTATVWPDGGKESTAAYVFTR